VEDEDLLQRFAWSLVAAKIGHDYARSTFGGNRYLHQAVVPGVPMVDHKDGNGLDCRHPNLRPATRSLNRANVKTKPRTKSGFRGVYFNSSGRGPEWKVGLKVNKRSIHLGYFESAEDAARAYDAAAIKAFGQFATVNFPTGGTLR
jgi:hypothetical protein